MIVAKPGTALPRLETDNCNRLASLRPFRCRAGPDATAHSDGRICANGRLIVGVDTGSNPFRLP